SGVTVCSAGHPSIPRCEWQPASLFSATTIALCKRPCDQCHSNPLASTCTQHTTWYNLVVFARVCHKSWCLQLTSPFNPKLTQTRLIASVHLTIATSLGI